MLTSYTKKLNQFRNYLFNLSYLSTHTFLPPSKGHISIKILQIGKIKTRYRLRRANKEEAFCQKKCKKVTFGIKHPFRKRRLHPLIPITCNLSTILDFKVLNMILNNYYYFTTSTKNRGKCRKKKNIQIQSPTR